MRLTEAETPLLKQWVSKKLEDISDADADVLADYVVALAKSDDAEGLAKHNCIENLRDFLLVNTEPFVDELFQAISTKSFDPSKPAPKPVAPSYQPPQHASVEPLGPLSGSRKRSYNDDQKEHSQGDAQIHAYGAGDRPMKHARRGGRARGNQRGARHLEQRNGLPQFPSPPPGMPLIDPNNPMATLMAMHQALGMFPSMPNVNGTGQRCIDYDTKGFCAAGASCPYEHGNEPTMFPAVDQPYDPVTATLANITPSRTGHMSFDQGGRGRGNRGRGRGTHNFRGGGRRSNHSQLGPSQDPTNTTIVVESIPEDKCDDVSVREFFSAFGTIVDVNLETDKRLAIIEYDTHDAAKAAYESPKVVFDNRFVKVFWYKSDQDAHGSRHHGRQSITSTAQDVEMHDGMQVDAAELARKQEEAQRKHEEAKKQRDEMTKQRQDLDAQLKAKEEERKRMADMIAKKTGTAPSIAATNGNGAVESEQTKQLKAQLAQLEAEAKSLGLNPDEVTNGVSALPTYRGRGGFRGRPRARGYRGALSNGRGGAVMRLDNRPKTVAVTFADGSYGAHEEALRQFLLFNSLDSATLTKHPERDDTALVAFNQRFEGENFMAKAAKPELLHIGKVDLSWYKAENKAPETNGNPDMDTTGGQGEVAAQQPPQSVETDVAEDEDLDHWS